MITRAALAVTTNYMSGLQKIELMFSILTKEMIKMAKRNMFLSRTSSKYHSFLIRRHSGFSIKCTLDYINGQGHLLTMYVQGRGGVPTILEHNKYMKPREVGAHIRFIFVCVQNVVSSLLIDQRTLRASDARGKRPPPRA